MKYLLISDIHGSNYYFMKAMKIFEKLKCDKIFILGDILYHGPRNDLPDGFDVKGLIDSLNKRKDNIIAVKGNCDAEVDQMVLDFTIEEYKTIIINNREYFLTHGHKINPNNPIELNKGSVVLYGHYHVPNFEIVDDVYYFNPGSISIPKNNSKHSFAIIENDVISLIDEDGSILNKYQLI